jgi:hypothetical protein
VAERLRSARQGNFRIDESRSAFHLPRTRGFPQNTEIETTITLTGDDAGSLLRSVSAIGPRFDSAAASFAGSAPRIDDASYRQRAYDPRVSAQPLTFHDYASPFTEPIRDAGSGVSRLQKKDPTAAVSDTVTSDHLLCRQWGARANPECAH